jgi:outer membrane protein TolC
MVRKVGALVTVLALSVVAARAGEKSATTDKPVVYPCSPDVKVRFLSLAEARAIALKQGTVGQRSLLFPGIGLDCLVQVTGQDVDQKPHQLLACSAADDPDRMVLVSPVAGRARLEFERGIDQMLLNVETAYWNLYGAYGNLHARCKGLQHAFEAWRIVKSQFDAGSKNKSEVAQARGQYELFRAQRLAAVDTVLDNERQLRALLGMQVEDGYRYVPCDTPSQKGVKPDWNSALKETLKKRPELILARQDVQANQLNLTLAKKVLLPDLRNTDTPKNSNPNNALARLSSSQFNDWQMGLRLNMPIGFRAAHANVRIAKLQLARSSAVLSDQELKAERFLGLQYRRIASYHAQIQAQRAQREAYAEQLKARNEEFRTERKTLDILLESQRFWADALSNEYAAIAGYNNALCAFAYAKGTIRDHAHLTLADKAPEGATVDAVERERQRTRARLKHRCGHEGLSFLIDAPSPRKALRKLFGIDPEPHPDTCAR